MAYGAKDVKFNTDSEKSSHISYRSRDCVGKVQNMAFFDDVFRISLIQIKLEFAGVGHLYKIIPLGFPYKTSLGRSCARVRQKSYNRSKMGHA